MDASILPIDLCEYIMDTIAEIPIERAFTTGDEQRTLCACALTCRAWRARAQFLLWKFPFLPIAPAFSRFSEALQSTQGRLRFYTAGIALHSSMDYDVDPPDYGRALNTLSTYTFPSLRIICFSNVQLQVSPRIFRKKPPLFSHIVTMRLRFCTFDSARALLDVVWGAPNLSSLEIVACHIINTPTATASDNLSLSCRNLCACTSLTDLHLYDPTFVDPERPIIGSVFGENLTLLIVSVSHAGNLAAFLKDSFPRLHTISAISALDHEVPEDFREPSWLQALSNSLANPNQLKQVRLVRKHLSDTNVCCRALVGLGEFTNAAAQRSVRRLLPGLEALTISFLECTNPESCATFVDSVLPSFRAVLRFERFVADAGRWDEYNPPSTH